MPLPIALQLFTVRDELEADFERAMRAVAEIGYRYVELPGLFDRRAEEVRALCDECGLRIVALMTEPNELASDVETLVINAEILGCKYIVCAYLPEDYRSEMGYRRAAEILNRAGKKLSERGLGLCYHNHAFEFDQLDFDEVGGEQVGFEMIFERTDPLYLAAELDVYWLQYGGRNPLTVMREFSGRVPLLHLKDMRPGTKRDFTEIGRGVVDIQSLVERAASCGVECLIVEQDANWTDSPLESARQSYEALTRMNTQGESK